MSNDLKVGFHKGLLLRKNTEEERATVSSTRLLMVQPDGARKVTHGLACGTELHWAVEQEGLSSQRLMLHGSHPMLRMATERMGAVGTGHL